MHRRTFVKSFGVLTALFASGETIDWALSGQPAETPEDQAFDQAAVRYLRGMNSSQAFVRTRKANTAKTFAPHTELDSWHATLINAMPPTVADRFGSLYESSGKTYRILVFDGNSKRAFFTDQKGVIHSGSLAASSQTPSFELFDGAPIQKRPKRFQGRLFAPLERVAAFYFPALSADSSCELCGQCAGDCTGQCTGCDTGYDPPRARYCCNLGYGGCPWCCYSPCPCDGCPGCNPCLP